MRRLRGEVFAAMLAPLLVGACSAQQHDPPLFAPAPGSPIEVAAGPGNVALGDVNRDGMLDVIAASPRGLTVLLGRGDGRFRAAGEGPISVPDPPSEMVLAELDGDGDLDIALANHDRYAVILLFGDGNGGFTPAPHSPVIMREGDRPHTHGLDVGDLNGDGRVDLLIINSDDHDVSVAFGDGKGGFTRGPESFPVGRSPYPAALNDLDGDGHLDIIATSTARGQEAARSALTILFGDGQGGFQASPVSLRTESPGFVAVADVNGDRHSDLVATHLERNHLTILVSDGQRGFTELNGSPFDLGHSAWGVTAMDVNDDGHADVLAAAGDGVRLMFGDAQGSFRPAPGSPFATGKGAWRLAVGDLNGDGRADVVTSNLESNSVSILLARKNAARE